jgi:hypothetical protein
LPNCGRRLIHHRLERPGCHAFQLKPEQNYALMKTKLTFSVSNGQTSRLWWTGDAICQGLVLPEWPIRANLYLNRPVIRWMSK